MKVCHYNIMLKLLQPLVVFLFSSSVLFGQSNSLQNYQWSIVPTNDDLVGRHGTSAILSQDKIYLSAGSGTKGGSNFK